MRFIKIFLFSFLFFSASQSFAESFPNKPAKGFILDEAGLINAEDSVKINQLNEKLLSEKQIPIIVVTIESLARYHANSGIESYTLNLFNNWGVGSQFQNYGILLLIAKNDREARIEFGADFKHRYDREAAYIMDNLIVPKFKEGNFSGGIFEGVLALDNMVRGMDLPKPQTPKWFWPAIIGISVLLIGISISLFRSGKKGWGWAVLAFLVVALIFIFSALTRLGGSGRFKGGSGGGGGATGKW